MEILTDGRTDGQTSCTHFMRSSENTYKSEIEIVRTNDWYHHVKYQNKTSKKRNTPSKGTTDTCTKGRTDGRTDIADSFYKIIRDDFVVFVEMK